MSKSSLPIVTLACLATGLSASTTSTVDNESSAAQAAAYNEKYRPQFHYTPAKNWINDPNGLVYSGGEYHLFYQYNPFGSQWGHMSWGHAVSSDLFHWKELPVALAEDETGMMFSGSAVVDKENSSGLCATAGDPCLVAAYTIHRQGWQGQAIASSTDNGRTWQKYPRNPVIDLNLADFRDPKVIWHQPSQKWIMAVTLPTERLVRFFASKNLIHWDKLSDFGPAGAIKGVWECPDLFPLPDPDNPGKEKWILQVGVNDGGPAGGSGVQYFIGDFDGTTYRNDSTSDTVLWSDYGKDYYAAQTWSDIPREDGRRIAIGWATNLQYAGAIPTEPWRGMQTLPRTLSLQSTSAGLRLAQAPASEITKLRDKHFKSVSSSSVDEINAAINKAGFKGDCLEIVLNINPAASGKAGIKVRCGQSEETVIGYDAGTRQVYVDRTRSGETEFHPAFAGRHAAPLAARNDEVQLRILVDRSSVEVFGNDGSAVITDLIFPHPDSTGVEVFAGEPDGIPGLEAWTVKSTWQSR